MMRSLCVLLISLALIFCASAGWTDMILLQENSITSIFFTQKDVVGVKCHLKGKVLSFSNLVTLEGKELIDTVEDKNRVVVRLYNTEGIKKDDILYIIDENKLVVSRLKAESVFTSVSFGPVLIGSGNFTLARTGYRVVQKIEDEHSSIAYIHKTRGDYYREIGDTGKALYEYKKAINLDKGNPDTHLAMGDIYYEKKMYQFAFREYQEGYKNISRLYDREDRFLLLKGMALVRYKECYEGTLPASLKEKYRYEGISFCREALDIYSGSVDINYLLGMFYYRSPDDDDVKARDHFLKVLDVDPEHVPAGIALSELYLKHKNQEKASLYLHKIISIDPSNKRARELLFYLEKYNK